MGKEHDGAGFFTSNPLPPGGYSNLLPKRTPQEEAEFLRASVYRTRDEMIASVAHLPECSVTRKRVEEWANGIPKRLLGEE